MVFLEFAHVSRRIYLYCSSTKRANPIDQNKIKPLIGIACVGCLQRSRWFVFHLSVLDPVSTCHCLSECLEEIREWSNAHPTHHILFIEIELKLTGDFLQVRYLQ